jgi:hypothetical protein
VKPLLNAYRTFFIPLLQSHPLLTSLCCIVIVLQIIVYRDLFITNSNYYNDFSQDYAASLSYLHGKSIYGDAPKNLLLETTHLKKVTDNYHPPFSALFFIPFAFLSYHYAYILCQCLSLIVCFYICYISIKLLSLPFETTSGFSYSKRTSSALKILLFTIFFLWYSVYLILVFSNVNIFVAWCIFFYLHHLIFSQKNPKQLVVNKNDLSSSCYSHVALTESQHHIGQSPSKINTFHMNCIQRYIEQMQQYFPAIFMGIACLLKLFPLIFIPCFFFMRRSKEAWCMLVTFGAGMTISLLLLDHRDVFYFFTDVMQFNSTVFAVDRGNISLNGLVSPAFMENPWVEHYITEQGKISSKLIVLCSSILIVCCLFQCLRQLKKMPCSLTVLSKSLLINSGSSSNFLFSNALQDLFLFSYITLSMVLLSPTMWEHGLLFIIPGIILLSFFSLRAAAPATLFLMLPTPLLYFIYLFLSDSEKVPYNLYFLFKVNTFSVLFVFFTLQHLYKKYFLRSNKLHVQHTQILY